MLNFENMRKVTNQMMVESVAYAENFWQEVLNCLKFNNDWVVIDVYEFYKDTFPLDADPKNFFEDICFTLEYTCFGQIKISFDYLASASDVCPGQYLLEEILRKNGFIQLETDTQESYTFVRSVF